jgi:hypothetical protein
MNGLLSSASPWQNDSNLNCTAKKRIPSLSIPRNKTTKKNIKPSNSALDNIYDIDNNEEKETDIFNNIFSEKENFQNPNPIPIPIQNQNTIESIQEENQNRMTRVQQLINNMNTEDDGQHLANFKPIDYSSSNLNSSSVVKPLYSIANHSSSSDNAVVSNPYSSYRDVYLGDSRIGEVSYFKNNKAKSIDGEKGGSISSSSDRIMEKLNRMLHILEEQQFEPTKHITEEFILYTFLGVFVIYIVDSFTRAGKYIR